VFPFLREITEHIVTAALQGMEKGEKLSVFSGHDTVIAAVLAGLGVYSGELCVWPCYASNLVIELWLRKSAHDSEATENSSEGTTPPSVQKLFPDKWGSVKGHHHNQYANSFVRVVYNGQDITQRVPSCRAERDLAGAATTTTSASARLRRRSATGRASAVPNGSGLDTQQRLVTEVAVQGLTLCSLEALVSQVAGLIGKYNTIDEACSA
jgi:hypothetical protein